MTNVSLLEEEIKRSGLKKSFIAKEIGISAYSLSLKINNRSEFKANEINILSNLLKIDVIKRDNIFFAN